MIQRSPEDSNLKRIRRKIPWESEKNITVFQTINQNYLAIPKNRKHSPDNAKKYYAKELREYRKKIKAENPLKILEI